MVSPFCSLPEAISSSVVLFGNLNTPSFKLDICPSTPYDSVNSSTTFWSEVTETIGTCGLSLDMDLAVLPELVKTRINFISTNF